MDAPDKDITFNELNTIINSKLKNTTLTNYLIQDIKNKYGKNNKYSISKKNLQNINEYDLKLIIYKIYNIYIHELHFKKYNKLILTLEQDINTIYNLINNIFNNI